MIELAPADYVRAESLFEDYVHMRAAIWAVFEGRQVGRVFVDEALHPRRALLWHQDGYLAGPPEAGRFAGEAAGLVRRLAPKGHAHVFAADSRWLEVMRSLLAPAGARRIMQSTFRFDAALWTGRHARWREHIPADCQVAPLDARLADYPGIIKLWGSSEHFLAEGFGYALLRHGERVTKGQTVFRGAGSVQLGIDTLPAHRRRGYARLTACALIEHALAAGLTPTWQAYDNPASVALALELGFAPTADWPALLLPQG